MGRSERRKPSPHSTPGRTPRSALSAASLSLVLLLGPCGPLLAATCTSTGTGSWSAPATWACAGFPPAPGGVPGPADTVIIRNVTHTVSVTDDRTANALQFATGNQASALAINAGVTLTINGSMTVTGQNGSSGVRRVDVLAGGRLVVGNDLLLVGGSNNGRDVELRLGDAAGTQVTVGGDLAGSAAGGNFNSPLRVHITFLGQGTVTVGRNLGGNANLDSGSGTFVFNGPGAQSIGSYDTATRNFHHLTIAKAGGTATLANDIVVRGNLTDDGNFDPAAGSPTVIFAGSAQQSLLGTAAATSFYRVELDNGNHLALAHDLDVGNRLTLTDGSIITGPGNKVSISNGSAIVGAGSGRFVDGNLQKPFSAGNPGRTFELGTVSDGQYAPVAIDFATVSAAGNVTAAVVDDDHPDLGASSLNGALSVNRYWTIINGGVGFTSYDATFAFGNPGDLDPGTDPDVFIAERRFPPLPGAGSWTATTPGARTPTTNEITGETGFGDFAVATRTGVTPGIGRFNAYDVGTPAGQVTGVLQTKIAGAGFDVHLVAVNFAGTSVQTGFTGTVEVELLDASDDSGALDANACRSSWTVIQALPDATFAAADKGRITIPVAESEAWPIARIRIRNPAGTRVGCSTDAFAIRPSAFAGFGASHGGWENPGATPLGNTAFTPGGELHKAGRNFTVAAAAVNAESPPGVTSNYDGSPTAVASPCGPGAGLESCTAAVGTITLGGAFVDGQLDSSSATYDNVGSFNLRLEDTSFASIDSSDGTPADCSGRYICSADVAVGRFVPDHFSVSVAAPPAFGSGCGGGFTYVGQPFGYTLQPVVTVVAENFANNVTTYYAGSWWRITNATLSPGKQEERYTAATGSLDVSGLPATTADPVIRYSGDGLPSAPPPGEGTLTFSSGSGILFTRAGPVTPFDAEIGVGIHVIDADNVAFAGNPLRIGEATAGNGIAFNNGKTMRFGRLRATNNRGSQVVPLTLRLELEYWNGTAFVTHAADNCTTLAASNIELRDYTQNLAACETSLTVSPFAGGRALALLSGPGVINHGSVRLIPRLEQTVSGSPKTCIATVEQPVVGANLPYLEGRWDAVDQGADGLLYDDNPAGRATFGVYPGARGVIDIRENFQ